MMLEIIRILSMRTERLENGIIFLFNSAEEYGLQASHGFIMKHKWSKDIKVLVNLEAGGVGGKALMYQAGPNIPWLAKAYRSVPHPYAQAMAEELFELNIIPSDSDFRIFRTFGKIYGKLCFNIYFK